MGVVNARTLIILPTFTFFAFSIVAWKQPGCPENINTDVFYETVATRAKEKNRNNWLCEETFEFKVNICSSAYKEHILGKFDFEKMKVAKLADTEIADDCKPYKMIFHDQEVPELDIRVDVRMFKCPIKFKMDDPRPTPLQEEIVREFFITKGIAEQTVALLLSSQDKKRRDNICLEEIFLFNGTSKNIDANANDTEVR